MTDAVGTTGYLFATHDYIVEVDPDNYVYDYFQTISSYNLDTPGTAVSRLTFQREGSAWHYPIVFDPQTQRLFWTDIRKAGVSGFYQLYRYVIWTCDVDSIGQLSNMRRLGASPHGETDGYTSLVENKGQRLRVHNGYLWFWSGTEQTDYAPAGDYYENVPYEINQLWQFALDGSLVQVYDLAKLHPTSGTPHTEGGYDTWWNVTTFDFGSSDTEVHIGGYYHEYDATGRRIYTHKVGVYDLLQRKYVRELNGWYFPEANYQASKFNLTDHDHFTAVYVPGGDPLGSDSSDQRIALEESDSSRNLVLQQILGPVGYPVGEPGHNYYWGGPDTLLTKRDGTKAWYYYLIYGGLIIYDLVDGSAEFRPDVFTTIENPELYDSDPNDLAAWFGVIGPEPAITGKVVEIRRRFV